MSTLTQRFDAICERIEKAALRSGRKPEAVQLVAVSKLHGAEAVAELARYWAKHGSAGARRPTFGENYMQEARAKMPEVAELLGPGAVDVHWHFVGHVQSKKAKDVTGVFDLIHSVDSLKLATALQKARQSRTDSSPVRLNDPPPRPQAVLIQVNVGKEEQKSGVDAQELEELITGIAAMPELSLQGLMCLPPLAEIGDASRPYFIMLRELRDKMRASCSLPLPHLSMGMSDDFEAAIEEGATLVRIGTDIFGPRTAKPSPISL